MERIVKCCSFANFFSSIQGVQGGALLTLIGHAEKSVELLRPLGC